MLMREAAAEYKWNLNYAGIALMWRGGCIIKSYVPIPIYLPLLSAAPVMSFLK